MSKPFLSIEEQVALLNRRGMTTSERTPRILLREGYYSVVNGYKDPFIDKKASALARDDRYKAGSDFDSLYQLFVFDRELRELTFHHLLLAEATARTAIAYSFSEVHREPDAYLLQSSFCTKKEYELIEHKKSYARELSKLISTLRYRATKSTAKFIEHYRELHGEVPLWVLANDLTFGNLEHFFNLMKPEEQRGVCKTIAEATGRRGDRRLGYFGVEKARTSLEVLVKFRNICAHDERLYCAVVGDRKHVNYEKMAWMLERFLTEEEFSAFLRDLLGLFEKGIRAERAIAFTLRPLGFFELKEELERRLGDGGRW